MKTEFRLFLEFGFIKVSGGVHWISNPTFRPISSSALPPPPLPSLPSPSYSMLLPQFRSLGLLTRLKCQPGHRVLLIHLAMLQKHFFAIFGLVLLSLWSFKNLKAPALTATGVSSSNPVFASWLQGDSVSMYASCCCALQPL
jgi:hypothetical protein